MLSPSQAEKDIMSRSDIKQPYRLRAKREHAAMTAPRQPAKKPKAPASESELAYYVAFRDRLVAARKAADLTQEDLADLLDLPLAVLKQIEGKRLTRFPLHKLERLARALRQPLEYIIAGKSPRGVTETKRAA